MTDQADEEVVEPNESDFINFQCPEELTNIKEEDVSWKRFSIISLKIGQWFDIALVVQFVVWVDPLDGTAEYTAGIETIKC